VELDAVIFKLEERHTECKNGGVTHEDDLQYLESMIQVLKDRQTNITGIISGTGARTTTRLASHRAELTR